MDILEIALDQLTDYTKFERLATEVLAVEGYEEIRPIGGIQDDGIDAELTKYYENEKFKTIFQYSIQQNISSKISGTIKRLKEQKIDFDELIIVTTNKINTIQELRKRARQEHQVRLEILDRETFIKNLSVRNDIFLRHFPSIREQLNSSLFEKKSIFSKTSEEALETTLLKCSLLFTFNPKSDAARKDLLDFTILAIIVNEKNHNSDEIASRFSAKFQKALEHGELEAILNRLKKKNFITIDSSGINPTKPAIEKIEGNSRRVNSDTQALINEIVNKVQSYYSSPIDDRTQKRISENVKKSLSAYFSLYGLDYTDPAKTLNIRYGFAENTDLITLAKTSLPEKIGELTVLCIGEILRNPSNEQAITLTSWAKAFIAVQIMGLDPKLSNFQATRLSKKTFIVDTDFLLYCIVDDCKISSTYLKILSHLKRLRCTIIIPEEVIYEAIKHAEFAEGNYNYFKNTFESVDEIIVDQKIANVFVKGYYQCLIQQKFNHGIQFKTYLGNFYEKELPFNFLKEVIQLKLPDIEIKPIRELFSSPIPHDKIEELITSIQTETEKTFKSTYRTEEENREIAKTDALLFLAAYHLNQEIASDKSTLLGGSHYVITSSTRAQKCAKRLGYIHNVISKPQTIIALLDKLGEFTASTSELINLFENPYLVEIANNSWEDIKVLVDVGVSLTGKNVVRLKWELDSEIKHFIEKENSSTEESESKVDDLNEVDSFVDLVKKIKAKGYQLIPESETLIQKYDELSRKLTEKEKIEERMYEEIEKFGKRKQSYFDRIAKRKKRK